jgi:hypothetical protein
VERYLVICAPQLGDATFERLLSREGNFFDALTKPELGVERLHPTRRDAPTFPIWIDSEGTKLLVPDKRLLTAFESPERNQGLLFLDNAAPSDLRLTSLGGLHRYARLSAADFDLPDSIFFAPPGDVAVRTSRPRERLTGRLLRETRRSAAWRVASGQSLASARSAAGAAVVRAAARSARKCSHQSAARLDLRRGTPRGHATRG